MKRKSDRLLAEQLRETRLRILGNGIGKGLHFDVLVVEMGLGPEHMILPESPKRSGYSSIYREGFQTFSFD